MKHLLLLLTVAPLILIPPKASAREIAGFTLIDAASDTDLRPLRDRETIDLAKDGPELNIRADVRGNVGSVVFRLNGTDYGRTESVAPFALHGDNVGDYGPWTPGLGEYQLTAVPYSEAGGRGEAGPARTVHFTVGGVPDAKRRRTASKFPDISSEDELTSVPAPVGGSGVLTGPMRQWHRISLTFDGPSASETGKPNPYLHYRLNVTFTGGSQTFTVPGCYAGDGQGGPTGNKWRVHFSPPETGSWTYRASFRAGFEVNVSLEPQAGKPTACDGAEGGFRVLPSETTGADFRSAGKGLLKNRGHHYLTFDSGQPWVKSGPDIPENFLGYDGFINTPKAGHRYANHARDWRAGDPDWGTEQGKRIIGALNYIAGPGANCIYFLPMNIGGDGRDTFPTVGEQEKTRYHNAKLDQWEMVFAHAQSLGIFLHFQLAETEQGNENYHDGGELGVERKLYYRELIARFGHHNGLEWDLGEENDYGTAKRIAFAAFLKAVDPYDHPVTTHTHGGKYEETYGPLLGNGDFDMTAFQGGESSRVLADIVIKWRERSAQAGVPWAICLDEPQKIENDPADERDGYAYGRRSKMWPLYLSGGAGFEWYVQQDGGGHGFDHRIDDFRDMALALQWSGYALEFLKDLPLLEMAPAQRLLGPLPRGNAYLLSQPGRVYAIYADSASEKIELDLSGVAGEFQVRWFDPRNGGGFKRGSVGSVTGGAKVSLGAPPDRPEQDWACLVRLN